MRRGPVLAALALLGACAAPDYTPVRDWARAASLTADWPDPRAAAQDGVAAMQEALATYLAALARIADDGVLPYLEDPFGDLAARAARADAAGGRAVAAIGATLRRASRSNWQAPDLGFAVETFDPPVQALAGSLATALEGAGADPALPPLMRRIAETHAMLRERAGRLTRQAVVEAVRAEEARLREAMRGLPRSLAAS